MLLNASPHSSSAFRALLKLLLGTLACFALASAQAIPEITVEESVGTDLVDGVSSINYGNVILGASSLKTFTIKNTGTANLLNLAVTKTGTASTEFTVVTTGMATTLAPGTDTRFTVSFGPTGTTSGLRTAEIRIASNDANENPFNIAVSGSGVIPEIAVEQPVGTNLIDGTASLSYGNVATDTTSSRVFTVKNLGSGDLTGLAITKDGAGSSQFIINTTGMLTTLPPSASTTFTVHFMPTGASGSRAAFVRIASNDANENPFDIALTGTTYSTTIDTDGDGLHDWGEFQLAGLGFNWQTSQPTLVSALKNGAPAAGLFSTDQIQSLKVATSLTQDDSAPHPFKLKVAIEKATTGSNYSPVPLTSADTTITTTGNIELRFNAAEPGALFKVQTQ